MITSTGSTSSPALMFAGFALGSALDRANRKRLGNAAFWGLMALSFWFGDLLGDFGNGVLVLAWSALPASHLLGRGAADHDAARSASACSERFGNRLFLPALIIPVTALAGTRCSTTRRSRTVGLIDPKR